MSKPHKETGKQMKISIVEQNSLEGFSHVLYIEIESIILLRKLNHNYIVKQKNKSLRKLHFKSGSNASAFGCF